MQELHVVELAQGSLVLMHELGYHVQLAQLPLVGPVDEPVMHAPVLAQ